MYSGDDHRHISLSSRSGSADHDHYMENIRRRGIWGMLRKHGAAVFVRGFTICYAGGSRITPVDFSESKN